VNDWLDPVRSALDAALQPVAFFFRDDDAGWDDDALWRLLDCCQAGEVHVDVAVIPGELHDRLTGALCERAATGLVHLHQHGFRHLNHELAGRKCEFGPSRSHDQQLADIADGHALLVEQLHPYLEPVFTPPWNRCTEHTAAALANLGFEVLSRDRSAEPFRLDQLAEVPVTVDWFAKTKFGQSTPEQIGEQIGEQVAQGSGRVGVMLHHAVTDAQQLALIERLVTLVARHPTAVSTSIYSSSF
jgi:hypothetical protein